MPDRNLLVVEDDDSIRSLVNIIARRAGFNSVTASGGAEAIAHLATGSFAAVVLDLMMPDVSGYDVVEYIRDNGLNTPVVVMTAAVKSVNNERLDPKIVKAIIRKPFDLQLLTDAIDSACSTDPEKGPEGDDTLSPHLNHPPDYET